MHGYESYLQVLCCSLQRNQRISTKAALGVELEMLTHTKKNNCTTMFLAADGFSGLLVSSGFCMNRALIL